jgi:hypothetical protein
VSLPYSIFFLVLVPRFAVGHDIKQNTVQLQLRDNHFRIVLRIQILDWLSLLGKGSSNRAFSEDQITERLKEGKRVLMEETTLMVDQQKSTLRILQFPEEDEIVQMHEIFANAQARAEPLVHDFGWHTVQLEGVISASPVHTIQSTFSDSLGTLQVGFEEPQLRSVPSGGTAVFVLSEEEDSLNSWKILTGLLFCTTIFGFLLGRFYR